ncbi:MAG: Uncharacterized protein AWU57_520 [Marinobacter sp. T13-3]|nr:MAG: Uncharacterized protein AWU57_520 [Marinobacter sp. T13-3]
MIQKTLILSMMLGATFLTSGGATAETFKEYVEKQQKLETLDFTIERMNRLVTIKEAQHELDTVGKNTQQTNAPQRNGASAMGAKFFRPPYTSGDDAAMQAQSEARAQMSETLQKKQEAEQSKLAELAIMQKAEIVDVFRKAGPGSAYGAVLKIDDAKREVQPGDKISHWVITQITLNEITAKNEKYDGIVRRVKQVR